MNSSAPAASLPYAQASLAQRAQLLTFLQQRLCHHFPTLSTAAWLRALFEFQPTLVTVSCDAVRLDRPELVQLVQHVACAPELPLLDPPVYGLPALELAQRCLRSRELALALLSELVPGAGGPRLQALLTHLCQPSPLAEQVVQAWRWDLSSSPPLPAGLPGGGITLSASEIQRYLAHLGCL